MITGVVLTLNCNLSRPQADEVILYKLTRAWGEGSSNADGSGGGGGGIAATANDATWGNCFFPDSAWSLSGGDFFTTPSASTSVNATGFYTWSSAAMISDVQGWLNAPNTNFGWICICNEQVAATARKFGSRENNIPANRPALTISYSVTAPVQLSDFRAHQHNDHMVLNWTTEQEIQNDFFTIQQSTNGNNFFTIGNVPGNGTSSLVHHYTFTTQMQATGIYFFRLVQQDLNGQQQVSGICRILFKRENPILRIFPNPATDYIFISLPENPASVEYLIFDLSGTLVSAGIAKNYQVPVWQLQKGCYRLQLKINKLQTTDRIFVKNAP
jgi:hypothetical protein